MQTLRYLLLRSPQIRTWITRSSEAGRRSLTSQSAARVAWQELENKDPDQVASMREELVPIVDIEDRVIGARSKADCHLMSNIDAGLLHRAFSVLLYNSKDQFLLTQRTAAKITFPGYFTNACCSHPAATDEETDSSDDFIGIKRAAKRRLVFELGVDPQQLDLRDIHFMTRVVYKAGSDDPIWGEHELDYVLVIKKELDIRPNPAEVMFWQYMERSEVEQLLERANDGEVNVSQWFYKIYHMFAKHYWGRMEDVARLKDPNQIHLRRIQYRNKWL